MEIEENPWKGLKLESDNPRFDRVRFAGGNRREPLEGIETLKTARQSLHPHPSGNRREPLEGIETHFPLRPQGSPA